MSEEYVTAGEFDRRITSLEGLISRGFESIDHKQDDHANRIAKLETKTRNTASGWSAGVAGGVIAVFEIVKASLGK